MTIGELARWIRAENDLALDLDVVTMRGWSRDQYFDATRLYWINPSPNMRSLTQATLYPGVGLLEFTNLSVGRGTDAPFEWIGAPWLDGQALAHRVSQDPELAASLACTPVTFTPTASKFADEACRGVRFMILDRARFDPLRLGMVLACALRDLHPKEWKSERYRKLLAHRATRVGLHGGLPADELIRGWQPELDAFRARRDEFLLYR